MAARTSQEEVCPDTTQPMWSLLGSGDEGQVFAVAFEDIRVHLPSSVHDQIQSVQTFPATAMLAVKRTKSNQDNALKLQQLASLLTRPPVRMCQAVMPVLARFACTLTGHEAQYMVMEQALGSGLRCVPLVLERIASWDERLDTTVAMFLDGLMSLSAIHSLGILHHDIFASNILLLSNEEKGSVVYQQRTATGTLYVRVPLTPLRVAITDFGWATSCVEGCGIKDRQDDYTKWSNLFLNILGSLVSQLSSDKRLRQDETPPWIVGVAKAMAVLGGSAQPFLGAAAKKDMQDAIDKTTVEFRTRHKDDVPFSLAARLEAVQSLLTLHDGTRLISPHRGPAADTLLEPIPLPDEPPSALLNRLENGPLHRLETDPPLKGASMKPDEDEKCDGWLSHRRQAIRKEESAEYPPGNLSDIVAKAFEDPKDRGKVKGLARSYLPSDIRRQELPLFVVNFGPAGSGKSYLFEKVRKPLLGLSRGDFVDLNIDRIVEDTPPYKRFSEEWSKLTPEQRASETHRGRASQLYSDIRSKYGSAIFNSLLWHSLSERYSIVYESAGGSPDWLFQVMLAALRDGYALVVIWPVTSPDTMWQRIQDRADKTGRFVPRTALDRMLTTVSHTFLRVAPLADHIYMLDNSTHQKEAFDLCGQVLVEQYASGMGQVHTQCDARFSRFSIYQQDKDKWDHVCAQHWKKKFTADEM